MPLNKYDIALGIYVGFMIFTLFISYYFASKMIKKTGLFGSQAFISSSINLSLGIFAILSWTFFSWGVNEFLFFGGLILGAGLLFVNEVILFIALLVKRKKLLQQYNDSLNNND